MGMVEKDDYETLWESDELQREMKEKSVFFGFEEGSYDFPPTFKVKRGETDQWVENRTPSFCDRILWHSSPGSYQLRQCHLNRCSEALTSDHKPVHSIFNIVAEPKLKGTASYRAFQTAKCPDITFQNLRAEGVEARDQLSESDCFLTFHNKEGRSYLSKRAGGTDFSFFWICLICLFLVGSCFVVHPGTVL